MKWKAVSKLILSLGAMTMLLGTAAASTSASSSTAIRLLRDIKTDAAKIQSVAARWEGLTKTSGTTWLRYDRQWNEIKPAQEDMQIKLWRLEGMQAALSPVERAELDQSKPMIEQNSDADPRTPKASGQAWNSDERYKVQGLCHQPPARGPQT
jgi:hypothetical protein